MAIPNWLTLSTTAGTGNATVSVTASSYSELLERSAALQISAATTGAYLTITQRLDPSFSVNPASVTIPATGGSVNVSVTSDTGWTASTSASWLTISTISGMGNATVTLTAPAISSSSDRNTVVEFTNNYGFVRTISVVQLAISYSDLYLTIEAADDEYLYVTSSYQAFSASQGTIECRKNGGEWQTVVLSNVETLITYLEANSKVEIRGNNNSYAGLNLGRTAFSLKPSQTASTAQVGCTVYGNIMSLFYGDSFENNHEFPNSGSCLSGLFASMNILDASNLILPATTVPEYCYYLMFYNNKNMTGAPSLPATTLAENCYGSMFADCRSLTTAPALPATTLAVSCYGSMFSNCTSLTTAPALPATTLAIACYYRMFEGCTSLTTAPALPATTLAPYCYQSMFQGCTSLTTAPVLPATTLTDSCYSNMFSSCANLNYVKCLATNISASYCTSYWLNGVSATGTFVKAPNMTGWPPGRSGIPSGWTVVDAA